MKGINRMRRQDFLNNFGGYYLMLEKKLTTTFNYVELSTSNFSTFSNEYALLIQSIGAELGKRQILRLPLNLTPLL